MLAILQSQGRCSKSPAAPLYPPMCVYILHKLNLDNCDYNWIRRYCPENMDGQNCCFLLLCLCYFILCSAGCKYICSLFAISFFALRAVSIFDGKLKFIVLCSTCFKFVWFTISFFALPAVGMLCLFCIQCIIHSPACC